MLKVAIFMLVVFGIGACTGAQFTPPAEVEFIEVPKTEIVYRDPEPPETVTLPAPPFSEECKAMLKFANTAVMNAEKLFVSGQKQIQIISDTRVALYAEDTSEMGRIQGRQQDLHSVTVGYLANMEEAIAFYDMKKKECK